MDNEVLNKILNSCSATFYTLPFVMLSQIAALISCLIYMEKSRLKSLSIVYILAGFGLFLIAEIILPFLKLTKERQTFYVEYFNLLFQIVEYIFLKYFFDLVIKSRAIKKITNLLTAIFICQIVIFIYQSLLPDSSIYQFRNSSNYISVTTFLMILLSSFTFFNELLRSNYLNPLLKRPSFWISTGALFYAVYSVPVFVISEFFRNVRYEIFRYISTGHYVLFIFLHITLIIAFRCKKLLTI